MKYLPPIFCLLFALFACKPKQPSPTLFPEDKTTPKFTSDQYIDTAYNRDQLYNRILGMLVGSAIGDAMGAPTEMWHRKNIEIEYGFVDSLDKLIREASPEGPWDFNLSAGGTTDDTRWKKLTIEYLTEQEAQRSSRSAPLLDAKAFADHIIRDYLEDIRSLKAVDSFDPEPFETKAREMTWLQEWAMVARPYSENDIDAYSKALNRFYGGDLACAGMLYSPTIGAFYPGRPQVAYEESYKLGLFDLGYARDISSLTASMVAAALQAQPHPDSVINVVRDVDPLDYFKSRLIGRTSYRIVKQARYIVYEANEIRVDDLAEIELQFPKNYPYDSLYLARTNKVYELMDELLQDVPFHAGEIFLINATALLFTEMDFQKAMEFVTNYGRDNDTVGAITGSILGAYHGFDQLPPHLVEQVMATNQAELGINLEELAQQLTEVILRRGRQG